MCADEVLPYGLVRLCGIRTICFIRTRSLRCVFLFLGVAVVPATVRVRTCSGCALSSPVYRAEKLWRSRCAKSRLLITCVNYGPPTDLHWEH